MKALYLLSAFVVGALLPVQVGVNSALGRLVGKPLLAALTNFVVGIVALSALAVAMGQVQGAGSLRGAPWWLFVGGLIGASVVVSGVVVAPKLGGALFFAAIVAGQLAAGLLLDHLGAFGLRQAPISPGRVLGVVAVLAGVYLIHRS